MTRFDDMVYALGGVPTVGDGIPATTGKVYLVSSGTGSDSNDGLSIESALATIDAGVNKCVASKGDMVLVMPGHSETLTTAITCDLAGISIIGLGEGALRPQLTVNAAIDGITITADNVTIENLYFNEATNAGATANINVAAANATLRRIHMDCGANDEDVITITGAGERLTVENCSQIVTADGADSFLKFEGVVDHPVMAGCWFIGSEGTNALDDGVVDFNNQAVTNASMHHNVFNGGNQTLTAFANIGALVAAQFGPNTYAGSATDGDNVATITSVTLAANSIGASEIADNAIDAGAIAIGAIAADAFAAGAIDAAAIANGAIDAATFAAGAINAAAIADAAIDAATFAAGAIDAAAIADGAIDAATFAAGAIDATAIAASAIDAATFAAGAIDAAAIADDALDLATIADDLLREFRGSALNYNATGYVAVTADMSNATWNTQATHEVFTVTGAVRMRVLIECTETLTDAGDAADIQMGVENATTSFIAATGAAGKGGETISAGTLWYTDTPGQTNATFSSAVLDKVVMGGLDVGYELTGSALLDGTLIFHCWWEPLNATGAVVAGSGAAMV